MSDNVADAPRALCRDCCRIADGHGSACARCGGMRLVAHPELETLGIAHIDCDAFYAAVEKRDRPELAAQPVIIGHAGNRGVVVTACYIARTFGVRSAMPMYQAIALCPAAVVIAPDMAKYRRASAAIRVIFQAATSIIEPLSLDEAYLDLTDAYRTEAPPAAEALAVIAARIEQEVGITVSIGLSGNKFLAKLASDVDKPRGFSVIGRSEAKSFLSPLSVRKIHGVGAVTARRMEDAGIRTAADLQQLAPAELAARFGKLGQRLALYAIGEDDRRVTPDRPVKSISAETTLDADTPSSRELRAIARPLAQRVAEQLVRRGVAARSVVLKLKTSRFRIVTRRRLLPYPTQRAAVIFTHLAPMIDREADGRLFRLIGVGVGEVGSADAADPADLFDAAPVAGDA
jgi:DNA polymerase-4